jgi:hypothetical protein
MQDLAVNEDLARIIEAMLPDPSKVVTPSGIWPPSSPASSGGANTPTCSTTGSAPTSPSRRSRNGSAPTRRGSSPGCCRPAPTPRPCSGCTTRRRRYAAWSRSAGSGKAGCSTAAGPGCGPSSTKRPLRRHRPTRDHARTDRLPHPGRHPPPHPDADPATRQRRAHRRRHLGELHHTPCGRRLRHIA